MKTLLLILSALISFQGIAGVGGSVGGKGDRDRDRNNKVRDLDFYIQSRSYNPSIPNIAFKTEDSYTNVPVNEACVNGDSVQSKNPVGVDHIGDKGYVTSTEWTIVSRPLKYNQTIKKTHIFKEDEVFEVEKTVPTTYIIDIYGQTRKDHDAPIVKKLEYTLEDCE